jgi:autotransporter-associated beta strand protein
MKAKSTFCFSTKSLLPLIALGACASISYAQTTRTWVGGGIPATNMDLAANWSPAGVPVTTAPGDTAQWDGTVAGPLSVTYTAAGTGASMSAAGSGIFFNVTSTQVDPLTINCFSGTTGIRFQNFTVASGAGAVTLGGLAGADNFNLGNTSVVNHVFTNNSANPFTFQSDVSFSAGNAVTHTLNLTGSGNWNVNCSLIRAGQGTINVIKDGAGTLNFGGVNSAGNAGFTIVSGTIDNTSGAGLTLTNTTQTWNGDFSFSTSDSTVTKDMSLGSGNVTLGTSAGTSRTITTNGAALLTSAGTISNGTTANSLVKAGNGFLRLNGNNTFTGGVTLNAGVLQIGGNTALGSGTLTINGGGILPRVATRTLANPVTVNSNFDLGLNNAAIQLNFSGPIDLAGGSRNINVIPTISNPSSNMTGVISNGGLVKSGTGSLVLTANNTYSGETSVLDGSLRVQGTGAINSSNGITINGAAANFSHTSSVALTPTITLTQGTLESTGTVGTVNVADSATNIVSNGSGTTTLTATALNFAGASTINVTTTATGSGISTGTLTTSGTDDAVVLNISKTTPWLNGPNNLIAFGSFPSADINDFNFNLISTPLLGARQTMGDLVMNGDNIALNIIGTSIYWTGLESNQWTTNAGVGLKNWNQSSDDVATDFLNADDVVFNDTPGADQTVQIDDFDVSPTTTTFNNSAFNYTLASSSIFGIGNGILIKRRHGQRHDPNQQLLRWRHNPQRRHAQREHRHRPGHRRGEHQRRHARQYQRRRGHLRQQQRAELERRFHFHRKQRAGHRHWER